MFIIVKHAADEVWKYYFSSDPKKGSPRGFSCHTSYTGRVAGIKEVYFTREEAEEDLDLIKRINPCCGYAICPIRD